MNWFAGANPVPLYIIYIYTYRCTCVYIYIYMDYNCLGLRPPAGYASLKGAFALSHPLATLLYFSWRFQWLGSACFGVGPPKAALVVLFLTQLEKEPPGGTCFQAAVRRIPCGNRCMQVKNDLHQSMQAPHSDQMRRAGHLD